MSFLAIPVGASPNDGAGIPNREAWQRVNTMLEEIYTALEGKAALASVADLVLSTSGAIASLGEALASKASGAELLLKANAADVPRHHEVLQLEVAQKITLGRNTGAVVTFAFPLIAEATAISEATWLLPRLPSTFVLHDANLVVDTNGGGTWNASLTTRDLTPLGEVANVRIDASADGTTVPFNLTNRTILPRKGLRLVLQDFSQDYLDSATKGLTLWIRGYWHDL